MPIDKGNIEQNNRPIRGSIEWDQAKKCTSSIIIRNPTKINAIRKAAQLVFIGRHLKARWCIRQVWKVSEVSGLKYYQFTAKTFWVTVLAPRGQTYIRKKSHWKIVFLQ